MMRAASTSFASARPVAGRQPGDVGFDVDGRESRPHFGDRRAIGHGRGLLHGRPSGEGSGTRGAGQRGDNNQHLRFHVFGKRGRSAVHDTLLARASRAGIEWGDCTGPQYAA